MLHIRTMTQQDIPFAVQLTSQQQWELTEDDFKFSMELEREGCFILLEDSEPIGLATNISYGKIAWFGNLIVIKTYRNKGAGTQLVKHSIQHLQRNKVDTIGLYAYVERIPFYTRLGFVHESDYVALKGKGFSAPTESNAKLFEASEIGQLISYDCKCFGASRRKLLEPVILDPDNLCYVAHEKQAIIGYAVAKVYHGVAELGPLACQNGRNDTAINLIKAILNRLKGLEVSMLVPKKETVIIKMLAKNGFIERFQAARMFHGPPIPDRCLCLAESLERG